MSDLLRERLTLCENCKRYLNVEIFCDYCICLHNQKNSSSNSKQKDAHFTKPNIYSEVIVYPAFV